MSILLLILKIIGIILLVVLALLVLLVVGLLFVPFVYRIRGSYHSKPEWKASIYGFGYLFGFGMQMSQSGSRYYIRILGIRKWIRQAHKNVDSVYTNSKQEPDERTDERADEKCQEQFVSEEEALVSEHPDTSKTPERNPFHIVRQWVDKIKEIWRTLNQAIHQWQRSLQRFQKMCGDEHNRNAFALVKHTAFQLLKECMPRRMKLNLDYSTGSPDTTAQLLGLLAMFPIGYQNRWNVHPDFTTEQPFWDAEFDIKGRLLGIRLLILVLRLVLDKNCQKIYNQFRNGKVKAKAME